MAFASWGAAEYADVRARLRVNQALGSAATWMAAGSSRVRWKVWLGDERARENRGERRRGSQRVVWRCRMARGSVGASGWRRGSPATRGGRRGRGRRHGAPGSSWLGAEDAGVEVELVAYPDGRGEVGGSGERRRWRRLHSVVREIGPGERVRTRENERASRGSRGVLRATGRHAGRREVAGARRARAPAFWREVGGDWLLRVGWAARWLDCEVGCTGGKPR